MPKHTDIGQVDPTTLYDGGHCKDCGNWVGSARIRSPIGRVLWSQRSTLAWRKASTCQRRGMHDVPVLDKDRRRSRVRY